LLKIQLSTKDSSYKYEIRSNPQVITVKKGKAIEFEIFIKSLCICNIEKEPIMLFALDMREGKQCNFKINIRAVTEITILDPD